MLKTRRDWISLLLVIAAGLLDRIAPLHLRDDGISGAWLVPAIMGATALIGALKGKRQEKNNAEASRYQAEVQAERDRYEAAMMKAKRGERLRFGNAIARARGFALPEFDATASEGVNLNQPKIPEFKSGGFLEALGAGLGGVGAGITSEAEMNTRRGSLPETETEATHPLGLTSFNPTLAYNPTGITNIRRTQMMEEVPGGGVDIPSAAAPSGQADPYASLLRGTNYFSNLIPGR